MRNIGRPGWCGELRSQDLPVCADNLSIATRPERTVPQNDDAPAGSAVRATGC